PAAGDHRATGGEVVVQEPTAPLVVDPGVQRLAALTEPGGLLDPRSGDITVQRHRDIRFYKRHRGNPSVLAPARYRPARQNRRARCRDSSVSSPTSHTGVRAHYASGRDRMGRG